MAVALKLADQLFLTGDPQLPVQNVLFPICTVCWAASAGLVIEENAERAHPFCGRGDLPRFP